MYEPITKNMPAKKDKHVLTRYYFGSSPDGLINADE